MIKKLILILMLGALGIFIFRFQDSKNNEQVLGINEIGEIKAASSLDEQVKLYKNLIERVGPEQAQEELYASGMPFNGQTHLLNHTVGDWLYEKYGAAGLTRCKEYFLASCYHGFTLHAIASGGMNEVKKIMAECGKDGPTVSVQCSHAVGHGFLTSVGYKNLLDGLKLCDQATEEIPNFPLFNCQDGAWMENIWGVHEGKPSPDRWVKDNDPFYPCNDPRVPYQYINACWSNQPPHIYQMFGGDLKKVGEVCSQAKDPKHQETCFNGLARQIHPLADGKVEAIFSKCRLMPQAWVDYCVAVITSSEFSVGGRELPYEICLSVWQSGKNQCYENLFGAMRAYARTSQELSDFCGKVKEQVWRERCLP